MRSAVLCLVALAWTGCVRTSSVQCADGRVCPADSLCDEAHHACANPAAFAECEGVPDGTPCVIDGTRGLCDLSVCIAMCGDGVQDTGEECDCGVEQDNLPAGCTAPNGAAASECSSSCGLHFCGNGIVDPSEVCDDGNLDNSDDCALECLSDVTCGNGWTDAAIGESCDDENLASHDGCSSQCIAEAPIWRKLSNPWSARAAHGAAYDATRKQLVVVAGRSPAGLDSSLWERASTTSVDTNRRWAQRTVGMLPPPRTQAAMAYDSSRARVVLFGGSTTTHTNDTWEYDGTQWIQKAPATSPPARSGAAMVFDTARNRVVMHGGYNGGAYGDTWTWDGSDWTLLTATGPGRWQHGLAYDAAQSDCRVRRPGRRAHAAGLRRHLGALRLDVDERHADDVSARALRRGDDALGRS